MYAKLYNQAIVRNLVQIINNLTAILAEGAGFATRDTVSRIHTFQACAFDRSATPPSRALMKTGAGEAHSTGRGARASRRLRPCADSGAQGSWTIQPGCCWAVGDCA